MDKIALITGAARGIGRAVAAQLARDGYAVCINYLSHRSEAEALAAQLRSEGCRSFCAQADVADGAAVRTMIRAAEDAFGPVSLLVNNAGISPRQGLFQDQDDSQWERALSVNLGGARHAIRAVLPNMIHEKSGCIVNISSIWGLHGASCEVAYACTKAALVGLPRSLAMELAPSGIRVNSVAPGCIDTDMLRALGEETRSSLVAETPLGRLGTPEDIAHAVSFLASDRASFITGQVLTVDGGFTG